MSARLRKGSVQELSSLCTLKFFILTLEVSLILKPRLLVSFTILESFQMKCSNALVLPVTMGKHWPPICPLLILSRLRSNTQRLDFSVSVSFTDVTGPASPVFAAVPVLQAKFPHDFFYPFVSSSTVVTTSSHLILSVFVILLSYFC